MARTVLVGMRGGTNSNEERRKVKARGITLRGALDLHLAAKPLSVRTKEGYRYCCEQYLADWLDKARAVLLYVSATFASPRSTVRPPQTPFSVSSALFITVGFASIPTFLSIPRQMWITTA